jgi:hypothetical protein
MVILYSQKTASQVKRDGTMLLAGDDLYQAEGEESTIRSIKVTGRTHNENRIMVTQGSIRIAEVAVIHLQARPIVVPASTADHLVGSSIRSMWIVIRGNRIIA